MSGPLKKKLGNRHRVSRQGLGFTPKLSPRARMWVVVHVERVELTKFESKKALAARRARVVKGSEKCPGARSLSFKLRARQGTRRWCRV